MVTSVELGGVKFMRLVNLEVKNFRGIKELNVDFPIDLPVIF